MGLGTTPQRVTVYPTPEHEVTKVWDTNSANTSRTALSKMYVYYADGNENHIMHGEKRLALAL